MSTNLTKMQAHRSHDSSELNFSDGSDFVAAHGPVGESLIISSPRSKSQSTTLEQLFKDDSRSKQLSSPGAKLASFVNFILHGESLIISIPSRSQLQSISLEQLFKNDSRSKHLSSSGAKLASFVSFIFHPTKSKSKSTDIPQTSKTVKTRPPHYHTILQKELRNIDSYKSGNVEPLLVHQPMPSEKSSRDIDGFVEYMGLLNKDTEGFLKDDTVWLIELFSSLGGRRSIRRVGCKINDDDCDTSVGSKINDDDDCDISVCSSDLFELREL